MGKAKVNLNNAVGSLVSNLGEKQALNDNDVNVIMLNPKKLIAHPKNNDIFRDLEGQEYEELKESIEQFGILSPLVVRKTNEGYEILSGHQRCRVAVEKGIEVPAIVKNVDDIDAELILIGTNTKTRKLTDMELAKAIKREKELIQEKIKKGDMEGKASEHIAAKLGMNSKKVERIDRLNRLIPELQRMVQNSTIATGKAQEIALLSEDTQKALYEVFKEGLENMKLAEIKDIRKEYEGKEEVLQTKLESLEKKVNEQNKQIKSQEKEKEEIEKQIKELEENKGSTTELEKLKEELNNKITEIENLKVQAEKAKEFDNIKSQVQSTKEEMEKIKKEKEILENEIDNKVNEKVTEQLKEEVENLRKEYEESKDKVMLETKKEIEEKSKETIKMLEEEKAELEKKIKENESSKGISEDFIIQIKGLRNVLDNLYSNIDEIGKELMDMGLDEKSKKEIESLRTSLNNYDKLFNKITG